MVFVFVLQNFLIIQKNLMTNLLLILLLLVGCEEDTINTNTDCIVPILRVSNIEGTVDYSCSW